MGTHSRLGHTQTYHLVVTNVVARICHAIAMTLPEKRFMGYFVPDYRVLYGLLLLFFAVTQVTW